MLDPLLHVLIECTVKTNDTVRIRRMIRVFVGYRIKFASLEANLDGV